MDKKLLWTTITLIAFGLVALSSAGIIEGGKQFGSAYFFVKHQFLFAVVPGLLVMVILSKIDYKYWRKFSLPILFGALAFMILVFVPGVGLKINNAQSWIKVFGQTFQPAEFIKLALVIYFAAWFGGRNDRIKNWTYGIIPFFLVVGFIGLLLMLQPDLGTLIIVVAIALGVYLVAGVRWKDFAIMILIGLLIGGGLIFLAPYRLNRVKTFLNPSFDPRGISYQLNQSLIAIGSGGVFGVGFGKSTQKFGFLPEAVGDSIFAVIVEELGLIGAGVLISLFLLLAFFMAQIAKKAPDKFAKLYVMGIATWIVVQVFINIAAVTGLGPLTGLPLPFVSYGGTATLALLSGIGIILNISKHT
ncbi:MAG: putative lipid II flippase FtsW [Patescibacteria group bacterium]